MQGDAAGLLLQGGVALFETSLTELGTTPGEDQGAQALDWTCTASAPQLQSGAWLAGPQRSACGAMFAALP